MSKSKPLGGGRYLPATPAEHECKPPPIMWGTREGTRWQCAKLIADSALGGPEHECGKVWKIDRYHDGGKGWFPEVPEGPALSVFHAASAEQIEYWLTGELPGGMKQPIHPVAVVQALQKHFTIGVEQ